MADVPDEVVGPLGPLADEWGRPTDVDAVVADDILPFIDTTSIVGEIGAGGGRMAAAWCHTPTAVLLRHLGENARTRRLAVPDPRVEWVLLPAARLPAELSGQLDFIYAIHVFLNFDLHMMWRYLHEIERVWRSGGYAFVHTPNLTTEVSWRNFVRQRGYRVETHVLVTPETVRTLVAHTDLRIVRESQQDASNFYTARDYLLSCKRVAAPGHHTAGSSQLRAAFRYSSAGCRRRGCGHSLNP